MDELLKVFIDGKGTFYQRVKLSDNIEKEPDTGYLYCKNAILGHVGEQAYNGWEVGITDQKVVYVKREAKDVFDEDSMNSIKGKPVTLNHPDELVNSKNFKDYVVGFIDEVWQDGDNIVGVIVIQDEKAIQAVEAGELKDLSLGYTARLVKDEDGKLKQTEIVINHLAIVGEGRAKNARIVDEKTVGDEPKELNDSKDFYRTETFTTMNEEYDNDNHERITIETVVTKRWYKWVSDGNSEQAISDEKSVKDKKEVEKEMKTFIDFMKDWKEINVMPKSEFRDKAYEALNVECKEALQVELPALDVVEIKDSAIEKSVGTAGNKEFNDEGGEQKPKTLKTYSRDEETYFKKLYRSMDNRETAKKYASMTYMDVYEMFEGKGK
jgi:hypothetical protein